ncbi:MAG: 4-(cytidine 5'-diphospho)-2-C-methyl-D-erythritol kinase [Fidelibacterota bacterium]
MKPDLTLSSPAKVNLGLQVLEKRPDGYHNLHTVFQALDFGDTLHFYTTPGDVTLTASVDWCPVNESNTCVKAYRRLNREFPDLGGIRLHIEKRIPTGGGLGGGSSNAATTIKALNQLYDLGLSSDDMEQLGHDVGADVPFFIRGGTQLGEGTGEILTPLAHTMNGFYLLIIPEIHIATAWAYNALKIHLDSPKQPRNFAGYLQKEEIPFAIFENDFERIVIPSHPEIGRVKESLLKAGARYASLSGSGSTVFGIFDEEAVARTAESLFLHYNTVLTVPVRT